MVAFLRRDGRGDDAGLEKAYAFFASVLAGGLGKPEPGCERFRSYLLGALKNILANQCDAAPAQIRGGGAEVAATMNGPAEAAGELRHLIPRFASRKSGLRRHRRPYVPVRDFELTAYMSSFDAVDDFGLWLRREGVRRGMGGAQQVVLLIDGASGLEKLGGITLPGRCRSATFTMVLNTFTKS